MNTLWSKQPPCTWSKLWHLCICYFRNDKSLLIVNMLTFWIPSPYSFIEGDKGCIFSIASEWKPLFLLKISFKRNPGCPVRNIMQSSNKSIGMSRPIAVKENICEQKISVLINDWENIFLYWEESEQGEAFADTFGLFQIQLRGLGLAQLQENFAIFALI